MKKITKGLATAATATALALGFAVAALPSASAHPAYSDRQGSRAAAPVQLEVFAPGRGDHAGTEGKGWFVDLALTFHGKTLQQTGFDQLQLTGPAAHNNTAPFPGTFATGQDERLPGLVVLASTTNSDRPGFSGPGTNLANLFNLTGITDRDGEDIELWDTWLVGADITGRDVDSVLTVALVDDLDRDGVYNDAPGVVEDVNGDGKINRKDLKALGVASNIVTVPFHINGAPLS